MFEWISTLIHGIRTRFLRFVLIPVGSQSSIWVEIRTVAIQFLCGLVIIDVSYPVRVAAVCFNDIFVEHYCGWIKYHPKYLKEKNNKPLVQRKAGVAASEKNTSVPLWFPFLVFLRGLHSGYYTRGPACPLQVSHMTCATVLSPQPRPLQFKSCCRFSVFNVSRDTRARAQAKREHESNRTHTTATTMCAQPFPTFASCRFGGQFTIEIGHMCFMCGTNSWDGLKLAVTYGDTTLQR